MFTLATLYGLPLKANRVLCYGMRSDFAQALILYLYTILSQYHLLDNGLELSNDLVGHKVL